MTCPLTFAPHMSGFPQLAVTVAVALPNGKPWQGSCNVPNCSIVPIFIGMNEIHFCIVICLFFDAFWLNVTSLREHWKEDIS